MIVLGFDATGPLVTVGLADDDRVIGRWDHPATRTRGNILENVMDRALAESKMVRTDVEALALATGPGSLTAGRIAWATASGWAQAAGIPVTGWSVPELQRRFWFETMGGASGDVPIEVLTCLIHHRKEETYAYRIDPTQVHSPPTVITPDTNHRGSNEGGLVCGPALYGNQQRWFGVFGPGAKFAPEEQCVIGGDCIALWACHDIKAGHRLNLDQSPIDYGRPPSFRKHQHNA